MSVAGSSYTDSQLSQSNSSSSSSMKTGAAIWLYAVAVVKFCEVNGARYYKIYRELTDWQRHSQK